MIIKSPNKMSERPKKNQWSEPFMLVNKLSSFRAIPGANDRPKSKEQKRQSFKIEEIEVPHNETKRLLISRVNPNTSRIASMPLHYIRSTKDMTLPYIYSYELSERDVAFLREYTEKANTRKNPIIIDQSTLERIIVHLEMGAADLGSPAPFQIDSLHSFLKDQYKDFPDNKIHKTSKIIWNYWSKRREDMARPLLRELTRPFEGNKDTHQAFRRRDKKQPPLQSRGKMKQQIGKLIDGVRSLKLCVAIAATARIQEGYKVQQFRQKCQAFHRYMARTTGLKKTNVFDSPMISTDVSKFESFLRLNQNIFQGPRLGERRSPQDKNILDFFLGLYSITSDLDPDSQDQHELTSKTKMIESHRRHFNVPASKDLDEVMRMLGLEMSRLSIQAPPRINGSGKRSSRSQHRPRKYYNLKNKNQTSQSTILYSLRANDQSEEDFGRYQYRKAQSVEERVKKTSNSTNDADENDNFQFGYKLRPRK